MPCLAAGALASACHGCSAHCLLGTRLLVAGLPVLCLALLAAAKEDKGCGQS